MDKFDHNYAIFKLLEETAIQKKEEGLISQYDVDTFVHISSCMFPHNLPSISVLNTDDIEKSYIDTDNINRMNTDNLIRIEDLLDPSKIQTGELIVKKSDIMPQEVPDDLPSAEEYQRKSEDYANDLININMRQYSEPRYVCPKCKIGGMCRDESMTYLSYPPKYKYVCNRCGYVDYKHI